jgi:uncharacterized membrane protein
MSTHNNRRKGTPLDTSRTEAFSDGVFAVAITLLVLNFQVPQLAASVVSRELVPRLFELWPKLLIYVLSFVIVGIYWVGHHNTFHYIQRSDRVLLWINLLLLLCIVFIPFPTALIGQYPGQQISVVIYGRTLVMSGLVLQLLWWYATSNYRLVDRDIDPQLVQRATRRNLAAPAHLPAGDGDLVSQRPHQSHLLHPGPCTLHLAGMYRSALDTQTERQPRRGQRVSRWRIRSVLRKSASSLSGFALFRLAS